MALKLTGKDDRLTPRDFLALARIIELPITRAEEAMASISTALRYAVNATALPDMTLDRESGRTAIERVKGIVVERIGEFE
jgi:serine/threonine-protein kinase HipA